jgi:F-type H+-transporting ATPase subunit b
MEDVIHDTAFWVAIAFIIAVLALFKPASKMIVGSLDKRSDRIRDELDEARRLREEAQELLASYERKQREAEKEAEGIVAHAKEEAERLARRAATELEAQVARRRQQALDRIDQAGKDAEREVRAAAVDLALKATRKLLAEKIGEDQQSKLVDDAINEVAKRLH